MGNSVERYKFEHTVYLKSISTDFQTLMNKIVKCDVDINGELLVPKLIRVEIPKSVTVDQVSMIRAFLMGLRSVHNTYFVRFMVDAQWIHESNSGDIFYTSSGDENPYEDLSIIVDRIKSGKKGPRFDLTINIPFTCSTGLAMKRLSSIAQNTVSVNSETEDFQDLSAEIAHKFFNDRGGVDFIKTFDNVKQRYHILFVPVPGEPEYYPVLLFGLSEKDAIMKYRLYERLQDKMDFHYGSLIGDKPGYGDNIYALITAIQDSEENSIRTSNAKMTYTMAELALGCYLSKAREDDYKPACVIVFDYYNDPNTDEITMLTCLMDSKIVG